ncbi:DNA (cytosine-5)-methyltransferase CMT2-like isoform X3 [Panicum virgatum]|uniref:DNA (cytosine-5)-methyltransferase CMT2-like isoform X3 n=1 Tax=Panicum virgatum TaxID=38727 RepID=UPI0019D691A4|nr:DNA (cytosine-5)-methyltransferase CMT2-like isoform X3 [Panicum virgatum]
MEPPPPDPTSPPATGSPAAAEGSSPSPGGGDGEAAEGGFSAGLEPLWSLLFGDPEELEPMWSPPRDFGVGAGFAAPEPDADEGDAEGPWDGAPWRSTGIVAGEGAAAAFPEFDPAAEASTGGAAPEVRPLDYSAPDSASPVPPCSQAPVPLEVRAPELVPGWDEPALPPAAASSEAKLEECTLNSVPSPPAPPSRDDPDLGAEDGSSPQKITSGAMVVVGLTAVERPEVNAASCSMPDVVGRDRTPLRRSPRIVAAKAKAYAASLERNADSSRASKLRLAVSGRSSISEGSLLEETTTVDLLDGVKQQGSREIVAVQSSSITVVVALPVVNKRTLKNKAVPVSSPRKTRSASKVLVNSNRVSAVSPAMNCGPVNKAGSHIPPRKHKLASEKCLPSLERVDAVLHNSGLVSANKVEMPLELQAAASQPPKAKRARVSSGKCSSNLRRAENNNTSICKLPMVTVTSDPEDKPKLILDKYSIDSEMVDGEDGSCFFMGEAVPDEEARQRWPNRYQSNHCLLKKDKWSNTQTFSNAGKAVFDVKCHYLQASVCGSTLCIGDCAFIKGPEGKPHYIGRLLEFFETSGGEYYFSVQWFFRSEDTVMEDQAQSHDPRRLFYSDLKDDNLLDCIVSKVTIVQVSPSVNEKSRSIPSFHYYYDMKYSLDYSTFSTMEMGSSNDTLQLHYTSSSSNSVKRIDSTGRQKSPTPEMELSLLDLYCGCGGMSTGLCFGARGGGVNLIARWAVDGDEAACESFRLNHPETRVRWKGYGPNDDTWEPIEGLKNCKEAIRDFVIQGQKEKILPLPGDADVICGGPPCQGISGYNRNREFDAPFKCERNKQIIVFMDVIQFLKPKYIYMENVLDILKFADATLARYALSRLVAMHYQTKLGIMAAGCYGLPQFRMRVFLLGCHPKEKLPPFPLPTHEAIVKNGCPLAFERNLVGWPDGMPMQLEKPIVLEDALSDLPEVANGEKREEMLYVKGPQTEFQRYIRSFNSEVLGSRAHVTEVSRSKLYDHRPKALDDDNYLRVLQIPKKKGANFRDLPGVIVGPDNVARLDPTKQRILLPSGNPLVIDCVLTYEHGKSLRPYGRLWWDEVVGTVLTSPNARMQALIHPAQDRLLTIRESARLQGFPDSFRFRGTVKDRYRQIGNAVAVPVGRALGYALAMAILNKSGDDPLMVLPPKFAFSHEV